MPFHAAGGLVTAMLTSSTPAAQAAFSASSPPIPPEGRQRSARCFAEARSRRARSSSSHNAPPESTMSATPFDSRVSACSRTASWEAASMTTSGRAAISWSTPSTKGTPNSRASALPRELSLRPAIATTCAPPISPRLACSRKSLAMTPPPRRPTRMSAALRLFLEQALAHLLHVDDEALVRAARARIGAVVDCGLEAHAPALDVRELDGDRDFGPEQRRAHVLPVHLGSDGILSGVEVPEKKVAAGVFDVADDARGGVDAAIVAHEVDDARLVDGDFLRGGKAEFQCGFHPWFLYALLCLLENPVSSTDKLRPGLKGAAELVVGEEHTAPRVGSGRVHVLATPVMINVIEAAALAAIEHLLPEGHQSLGTRLDIRHFAATPVGMRVRAEVEVVKVEGRTVTFRVSVADEKEPIGDGAHERMVVNVARFDVRVQDKVAMVRGRT